MIAAGMSAFFIFILGATYTGRLPVIMPIVYGAMSIAAFVIYAIDKSAAKQGRWRISERTLHLLALAGGWPGALAAQRLLRHKNAKREFQVVFWITVLVNCLALAWYVTPPVVRLVELVG